MLHLFKNVRTKPPHLTTYRVIKKLKFNPTPIDRVNKLISYSNTYRLTYKCFTFLEMSGQGIHNPTPIDRVNKLMTNNIRSTYNCHTFMELSGQVHQTIVKLLAKSKLILAK